MIEFYQTGMGHDFYMRHVPSLVDSMKRIADSLEKLANPMFAVDLDDQGGIAGIRMLMPGQTALNMAPADKLDQLLNQLILKDVNTEGVKTKRFKSSKANRAREEELSDLADQLCKEARTRILNLGSKRNMVEKMFNEHLCEMIRDEATQDAELTNGSGWYGQVLKVLQVEGPEEGAKMIREAIKEAVEA